MGSFSVKTYRGINFFDDTRGNHADIFAVFRVVDQNDELISAKASNGVSRSE